MHDDQPLGDTDALVGLALCDEVTDLEAADLRIVQVDEAALGELLPLREVEHVAYPDWSVRSFRLATSGVAAATQVHTHLCHSEFSVVVDAIDALGADVTSIESACSRGELLESLEPGTLPRGIGPQRLWVNPDCGRIPVAAPRPRRACATWSRPPVRRARRRGSPRGPAREQAVDREGPCATLTP